jgi:hypothetical protein
MLVALFNAVKVESVPLNSSKFSRRDTTAEARDLAGIYPAEQAGLAS